MLGADGFDFLSSWSDQLLAGKWTLWAHWETLVALLVRLVVQHWSSMSFLGGLAMWLGVF